MQKTQNLRDLLTEVIRNNHLEPKILEQKVFDLWRKHFGTQLGSKTIPVSLSNGILKIYTEYPPYRRELLFLKEKIIANLNAELEEPVLTDLRIELRQVRAVPPRDTETEQSHPDREPSQQSDPDLSRRTTPEELERIEQTLAGVTDEKLKKSLRQLFTTQSSKDNP